MPITFQRGQVLGPNDLNVTLRNDIGEPTNAYNIYYTLYDMTQGAEVLIGPFQRIPSHTNVGFYYAPYQVPFDAAVGLYRIRWHFWESASSAEMEAVEDFSVASGGLSPYLYTQRVTDLIQRLRILLRDNNPDRNYRFAPPSSEDEIQNLTRTFGYIWEDYELSEYLQMALDRVNMYPPETDWSLDNMLLNMRTMITIGASTYAFMARAANWVLDEFSVAADSELDLMLEDGEEIRITIGDLWEIVTSPAEHKIKLSFEANKLCVKSSSLDGKVTYESISDVLRHKVPYKRTFTCITEKGRKITTTEDHSLFALEDDFLREIQPRNLDIDDKIVVIENDKIVAEELRSIIESEPHEFMFDLSVPGNENFMLSNGILAHNSYSISAISLDIDKSAKYESLKNNAEGMFDKMVEQYKKSIHIMKGLNMPRYGIGLSVHLGPFNKSGVVSPRNYASFNVRGY